MDWLSESGRERFYSSIPSYRDGLPPEIIGFAILELLETLSAESLLVEDLLYSRGDLPSPGSIFRLTEQGLITKLEQLVDAFLIILDWMTQPVCISCSEFNLGALEILRTYYQPYLGEAA